MPPNFQVDLIEARSEIPLYLYSNGTLAYGSTISNFFRYTLWKPGPAIPDIFVAFDASPSPPIISDFDVTCTFSPDLAGKKLELRGVLNDVDAISSRVKFSATNKQPIVVSDFTFCNQFEGPVAYRGNFKWKLLDGDTVITASTTTDLEFYSVLSRSSPIWPASGLSGNLLRNYSAILHPDMRLWKVTDFYRDTVDKVFRSLLYYDSVCGSPSYISTTSTYGNFNFKLNLYLSNIEANLLGRVNCFDMAGIVQIILTTYRGPAVWTHMETFGYISQANLKGWGDCNNPFFNNALFNNNRITPPNVTVGLRDRSRFDRHVFIAAPTPMGNVILDATSGPNIGVADLQRYLSAAIDKETDYYSERGGRYGRATDANYNHGGIIGVNSLSNSSSSFCTLAEPVESQTPTPVDKAMDRAKVEGADPARFSQIDPTDLKSLLGKMSGSKFTLEEVNAGEKGSEAFWLFGDRPDGVEVTLFAADTHENAVQCMRNALTVISAPLDRLFISTLRLGQLTLEAVGGRGLILFVRGNVFIKLIGMASSEKLGEVAVAVNGFLKEREGGSKSVPTPRVKQPERPDRQLKLGGKMEVVIDVKEAGWISVSSDSVVLQLIKVDEKKATFEFHAGSKGKTDVRFVFAHKTSLQTATVTMHVEVTGDDPKCKLYPEALAATEKTVTFPQASPSPSFVRQLTELSANQLSYGQLHAALESSNEAICRSQVGRLSSASRDAEKIRNEHLSVFKSISSPTNGCGEAIDLKGLESAYTTPRRTFNRTWAIRIAKAIVLVALSFALTFIWEFYSKS